MTGIASKFLGPLEIDAAIKESLNLAGRSKLAIAGGVAMQIYGSDRLTRDVDFIAKSVPPGISVQRKLSFGGVSGKTPNGISVCFIVRNDDYASLYREALSKTVEHQGYEVISPEHLAAMKLVAGRTKDESDLLFLLMNGVVDVSKARVIIKKHLGAYALDDFNSRVDEAEWRKIRDSKKEEP